ncbi:MAG: hypothetical protein AB7P33_02050 [Dehalococcoidia bacterium]
MRLRDIPPIVRAAVSLLCVVAGIALLYFVWIRDDSEPEPTSETQGVVEPICPSGWTDFDNSALRFKICLPSNMLFSNGTSTQNLSTVSQTDPAFVNDFHVVNPAFAPPWPATPPSDPTLAPLRIAVRTPAADLGIEGCALRAQPADAKGVQSCSDAFFILDGLPYVDPAGDLHRFRAILPGSTPARPLYLQADSMTAAWATGQQALVQRVLESIRPY